MPFGFASASADQSAGAPADLLTGRYGHTATVLANGKVLVVGGWDATTSSTAFQGAELYDPATNSWTKTGPMAVARRSHTASLLSNGLVLVVGGYGPNGALTSTELYDPALNAWYAVRSLNYARYSHTATLLANGQLLVIGGAHQALANYTVLSEAELYDPVTDSWTMVGSLTQSGVLPMRAEHTATLLADGNVLVVGGYHVSNTSSNKILEPSAVLYDAASGAWLTVGSPSALRYAHSATLLANGKVLVAGGYTSDPSQPYSTLFSGVTELYDPATRRWSAANPLPTSRAGHTATLLPDGRVLVAGGRIYDYFPASAEIYDSSTNTWVIGDTLTTGRAYSTATVLSNGKVLVVGGLGAAEFAKDYRTYAVLTSSELFDPLAGTWTAKAGYGAARWKHAATTLRDGKILVSGGYDGGYLTSVQLYDPWTDAWTSAPALSRRRVYHTSTLLANGSVLVAGGADSDGASLAEAALYDPGANKWTAAASLSVARRQHTAVALADGRILVVGGVNGSTPLSSAELYDPATNGWTAAGTLATARYSHTATVLSNGKVLIVGGTSGNGTALSAELFDPPSKAWTVAAQPAAARVGHTSTLLPNGGVLVTGGGPSDAPIASVELYDPVANAWKSAGQLSTARSDHTATLLSNGKVAVAGGLSTNSKVTASVELYDPATNSWSASGSTNLLRRGHNAAPLSNGKVLLTGGLVNLQGFVVIGRSELLDPLNNAFSPVHALANPHYFHKTLLLPDGKVLMVPEYTTVGYSTVSAIYDPDSDAWTPAGDIAPGARTAVSLANGNVLAVMGSSALLYDYAKHAWLPGGGLVTIDENSNFQKATLLSNGKVLLTARGRDLVPRADLYNPATNLWSAAAAPSDGCSAPFVTLLPNGKVFIVGYSAASASSCTSLYDPASNTWTQLATPSNAKSFNSTILLPTGKVLFLRTLDGGDNVNDVPTIAAQYDPASDSWSPSSAPSVMRSDPSLTLLPDGKVLVAGGSTGSYSGNSLASAELYDPIRDSWTPAGTMVTPRAAHAAVLLKNGKVLLSGGQQRFYQGWIGVSKPIPATAASELYDPSKLINYSDSWWNANESGWGVSITDHGANAFVQWYNYDQTGHNQKYVMSGGTYTNGKCSFSGTLWRVSGPSWNAPGFDPNQVVRTNAGSASFDFCPSGLPADAIVFNYSADGISGNKQLTRLAYGNDAPRWGGSANGAVDYTDLWWNPAESGWGVSIAQHGNNLFARIFVYDTDGRPLLFVMSGGNFTGPASFSGILQQTSGPWFGTSAFDPSKVTRTTVGNATLTFSDAVTGVLTYTVNGVTKTKAITRMQF